MTESLTCSRCGKECPEEEIVLNFGWCDECFDEDYTNYCESMAGPYDWLPETLHGYWEAGDY